VSVNCVSCHHDIDDAAKICAFCGSDPRTGEKIVDAQAMLQEMFKPKPTGAAANIMDFARHRQGAVVAGGIIIGLLLLGGLYQFAVHRNATAANPGSGVLITEVTDLTEQDDANKPLPMPALQFQYDGRPQAMRTFIVEPGAAVQPAASAPTTTAPTTTAPPPPPPAR
jgi:hypothetical protein